MQVTAFIKACQEQIDILKNNINGDDAHSKSWLGARTDDANADTIAHKHGVVSVVFFSFCSYLSLDYFTCASMHTSPNYFPFPEEEKVSRRMLLPCPQFKTIQNCLPHYILTAPILLLDCWSYCHLFINIVNFHLSRTVRHSSSEIFSILLFF